MKKQIRGLGPFLVLWSTQALSRLGSQMTAFALTLWLYEATGSALKTALLGVCSYGPYVLMSVFAGALSDRWDKKRTLLACDTLAACCSAAVLVLLRAGALRPGHLYALNALAGLMNTVQQPAGEVAMTLITPRTQYQRASALRSLSDSLTAILHPPLAAALFALAGMEGVIWVDLATFAAAFLSLALFVSVPPAGTPDEKRESLWRSVTGALGYLRAHGLILTLILFMAGVNLAASAFDAALPPYVLAAPNGGEAALGWVSACAGLATLAGSFLAAVLPPPRDRVRLIWRIALFSLGSECFLLALVRTPFLWWLAQIVGWLPIPVMNASLGVILRGAVPVALQGRVYACRNALQFFTIPLGTLAGGALADSVRPPSMVMLLLGLAGAGICLAFRRALWRYTYRE